MIPFQLVERMFAYAVAVGTADFPLHVAGSEHGATSFPSPETSQGLGFDAIVCNEASRQRYSSRMLDLSRGLHPQSQSRCFPGSRQPLSEIGLLRGSHRSALLFHIRYKFYGRLDV